MGGVHEPAQRRVVRKEEEDASFSWKQPDARPEQTAIEISGLSHVYDGPDGGVPLEVVREPSDDDRFAAPRGHRIEGRCLQCAK